MNEMYLNDGTLDVQLLGRGYAWLDPGTMNSLLEAANFIRMIEERQSIIISAPEEISFIKGWISAESQLAERLPDIVRADRNCRKKPDITVFLQEPEGFDVIFD